MNEEYQRIMALFERMHEGKKVDLEELMDEATAFFAKVKEAVKKGTPEERQELRKMVQDLHDRLAEEAKFISQKAGMSEEEIGRYLENPANFSPARWRSMQETRQRMQEAGKEITRELKAKTPSPRKTSPSPKLPSTSSNKIRKHSRDKWLRS